MSQNRHLSVSGSSSGSGPGSGSGSGSSLGTGSGSGSGSSQPIFKIPITAISGVVLNARFTGESFTVSSTGGSSIEVVGNGSTNNPSGVSPNVGGGTISAGTGAGIGAAGWADDVTGTSVASSVLSAGTSGAGTSGAGTSGAGTSVAGNAGCNVPAGSAINAGNAANWGSVVAGTGTVSEVPPCFGGGCIPVIGSVNITGNETQLNKPIHTGAGAAATVSVPSGLGTVAGGVECTPGKPTECGSAGAAGVGGAIFPIPPIPPLPPFPFPIPPWGESQSTNAITIKNLVESGKSLEDVRQDFIGRRLAQQVSSLSAESVLNITSTLFGSKKFDSKDWSVLGKQVKDRGLILGFFGNSQQPLAIFGFNGIGYIKAQKTSGEQEWVGVLANDSKQASFPVASQQDQISLNRFAEAFATLRAGTTQSVSSYNQFVTTISPLKTSPTFTSKPNGDFILESGQTFTGIVLEGKNSPRIAALVPYNW